MGWELHILAGLLWLCAFWAFGTSGMYVARGEQTDGRVFAVFGLMLGFVAFTLQVLV